MYSAVRAREAGDWVTTPGSGTPSAGAMREQLGANLFVFTLIVGVLVNLLVIASEIGGVSLALQLVTGIAFHWWALPVALVIWILLW
jgi:Mn2+/Fe2+ NRAMP family transporter